MQSWTSTIVWLGLNIFNPNFLPFGLCSMWCSCMVCDKSLVNNFTFSFRQVVSWPMLREYQKIALKWVRFQAGFQFENLMVLPKVIPCLKLFHQFSMHWESVTWNSLFFNWYSINILKNIKVRVLNFAWYFNIFNYLFEIKCLQTSVNV
jgi:hypothetical protein